MKLPCADPALVIRLVEVLRDPHNAEPANLFPRDPAALKQPGLYAWWVDEEGRGSLAEQLILLR
jgi:hypothetical protein